VNTSSTAPPGWPSQQGAARRVWTLRSARLPSSRMRNILQSLHIATSPRRRLCLALHSDRRQSCHFLHCCSRGRPECEQHVGKRTSSACIHMPSRVLGHRRTPPTQHCHFRCVTFEQLSPPTLPTPSFSSSRSGSRDVAGRWGSLRRVCEADAYTCAPHATSPSPCTAAARPASTPTAWPALRACQSA
jgi:hypothetical protein